MSTSNMQTPITSYLSLLQDAGFTLAYGRDPYCAKVKQGLTWTPELMAAELKNGRVCQLTDAQVAWGGVAFTAAAQRGASIACWAARLNKWGTDGLSKLGEAPAGASPSQLQVWAQLRDTAPGGALLTGGPGSGKTWLMGQLVTRLTEAGLKVKVVAPSAKAAHVLSTKLRSERVRPTTIHRALGIRPGREQYAQKLGCDALVMDEASMADEMLLGLLLSCVDRKCFVLLCGDQRQLPPVGAGQPFRDLCETKTEVPVLRLLEQHRNDGTDIGRLATAVFEGSYRPEDFQGSRSVTCFRASADTATEKASAFYTGDYLNRTHGRVGVESTLILSPVRAAQYEASIVHLNKSISDTLHPTAVRVTKHLRVGDRVMFSFNDEELGTVNGATGYITGYRSAEEDGSWAVSITEDTGQKHLLGSHDFDERRDIATFISPAAAMTVYKAQGSEADHVLVLLDQRLAFTYTREMLLTAITRAKKSVTIMGDVSMLASAHLRTSRRLTCLQWFLAALTREVVHEMVQYS